MSPTHRTNAEPNASLQYRSMSEKICLDRVQRFGQELVTKRGVVMDSFLWDDGWDNQSSLWDFNQKTFPRGFDEVNAQAKRYEVGTGVWVSPWGGYGEAKESRLAVAKAYGNLFIILVHFFHHFGPFLVHFSHFPPL